MSLEESELQEPVAQSKESEKMDFSYEAFRNEVDRERTGSMERHPRVGLLPSPELLTQGFKLGKDATDTQEDFRQTFLWLREKEALNTEFYKYYKCDPEEVSKEVVLEEVEFGALIKLAFGNSFDAIRHTANLTLDEYVIWYYAGHGRDNSSNNKGISSMPKLEKVGLSTDYNDSAKHFAKHLQDKPVKGGELCLHDVGYCGLYGLIAPWIASVKDESQNRPEETECPGKKENKHLIIILDSCYAGMIADDLEKLNKEKGPWNENGCSISIQTACGPDECTYGGYFTPCFLTLNEDENLRERLKEKWEAMEEKEKEDFRRLPLPSPTVVTTRATPEQNSLTMEFSFNNGHKLTLFSDSGFFKFCSVSVFECDELKELHLRVSTKKTTRDFMENTSNFTILDYKLKTLQNGPFEGSPMGLFLIEEPGEPKFAVCAHVHFAKGDTSRVRRINLVHHLKPPSNEVLYVEQKKRRKNLKYAVVPKACRSTDPAGFEYWKWNTDDDEDPSSDISFDESYTAAQISILKDEVNKGAKLVKKCHRFVEDHEPGRWKDLSKWNMTLEERSYRGNLRQAERSQWMDQYKKKCDKS